jgi:hypothetical protein
MSEQSSALKWPGDVELFEPSVNQSTYFNGIRAVAVDGIVAHLSFYVEHPSYGGNGSTEFVVVGRMMTPLARAKPFSTLRRIV